MGYKNNIPKGTDDMGATSYLDIQNNFAEVETFVEVDHRGFDQEKVGKHDQLTFPKQSSDPSTGADELALYSKLNGDDVLSLFLRGEKNGPIIDLTSLAAGLDNPGWTRLSTGLLIKWENDITIPSGVPTDAKSVTFDTTAGTPKFKEVFCVYPFKTTSTSGGLSPVMAGKSLLGFSFRINGEGKIGYFAIGI